MTYAGVQPDLGEEAGWWRVEDLWFHAAATLVIYTRAAADIMGRSVRSLCEQIPSMHDIYLASPGCW